MNFANYTTPLLRRQFCQQEVILNTPLAPGIYLGVAPVLHDPAGLFSFGPTYPVETVPFPGEAYNGGIIVDYAVVMRRLPDEATLKALIEANQATSTCMHAIAHTIARFHLNTPTNAHIAHFGSLRVIQRNWEENFRQIRPYIGRTLDRETDNLLHRYAYQMLKEQAPLFQQRVAQGHIRDCHGDLRPEHIYVFPAGETSTSHQIVLLDRIEFNERFRYGDTASEIAFLVMELTLVHRLDLAKAFLAQYVAETNDNDLLTLLPFYACYRACVRGKVISFLLDDPDVTELQRAHAKQEASTLFTRAARYARTHLSCCDLLVEEEAANAKEA
ncbi:hypothetical protein KSX_68890 [Ktedonospora formicarum]|uniref:Aminoglycoside phosphotransferase domain-containing protein n=1 Tax=Ktedonospora formicarum TaxID=2778364 RepID=A0A8J3I4U1_9CHLR|nr:hypothetical protein KSX_68890 [Ktedonospora formicarum]